MFRSREPGVLVMAKDETVGSDKAELKKLIKMAKDKPVHMAFAMGPDGKAVVQLHKLKPPRTLEKDLKEGLQGSKNHRFGTIMLDPEDDKRVKFVVNKAVGGFARKLVIALKGTGYKKIQIVTENGEALEEAEGDEEDEEEGGDSGGKHHAAGDDDEPATSRRQDSPDDGGRSRLDADDDHDTKSGNNAGNDSGDQPDAATLTKDLTGLVKQMLAVIKKDPSAKAALAELATDAQVNIKRGDLEQAAGGIEILRDAIQSYSGGGSNGSGNSSNSFLDAKSHPDNDRDSDNRPNSGDDDANPRSNGRPPPRDSDRLDAGGKDGGGKGTNGKDANGKDANGKDANGKEGGASVQKFHKSRVAWTATRAKVDAELQKLSKAIRDASEGEDMVDSIEEQFFKVVDPVLAELDESLSDTLADAANADGEERERLLDEARSTIKRYTNFVSTNSIISDLDNNPFVPLAIGKTLTSTLSTLSSIMR